MELMEQQLQLPPNLRSSQLAKLAGLGDTVQLLPSFLHLLRALEAKSSTSRAGGFRRWYKYAPVQAHVSVDSCLHATMYYILCGGQVWTCARQLDL